MQRAISKITFDCALNLRELEALSGLGKEVLDIVFLLLMLCLEFCICFRLLGCSSLGFLVLLQNYWTQLAGVVICLLVVNAHLGHPGIALVVNLPLGLCGYLLRRLLLRAHLGHPGFVLGLSLLLGLLRRQDPELLSLLNL